MSEDFTYQDITDDIIAELQGKYNLIPRNKSLPNVPAKKIFPRSETDEATPKVVDK
jgi:hypothetical protein